MKNFGFEGAEADRSIVYVRYLKTELTILITHVDDARTDDVLERRKKILKQISSHLSYNFTISQFQPTYEMNMK